jgi:TM2 domain-containing membrane protein YozV
MKYAFLFVSILISLAGIAQNKSELPFIEHLINKGYYKEAIYLIDQNSPKYTMFQQDSVNYFRGWAEYSQKNLQQSTISLIKVSEESPFHLKSSFFAGYNQIFLENYSEARTIMSQIKAPVDPNLSLVNLELSGIEMLQENWPKASELLQQVNPEVAMLNQQAITLGQICKKQAAHRYKSPLLAGIMSGIIPGSGKIYAGKTGEGIASMIATTGFGLITWENYRKLGIGHAKTIFFGCIFAANYVSNIYGSVISVKIIENEYKDATHNQILFQLHIPLRNFFE